MKARIIFILFAFCFSISIKAQEKWDLRKCVSYAIDNNISVKQTDLQARFSKLNYEQSKLSVFPSLNLSGSAGYRFGRSENPTTGVLEDNNFLSSGFSLQTGTTLFGWFSKKNQIESDRLTVEADQAQIKKVQDDIALNVAVAYLQILLSKEQINLSKIQLQSTNEQFINTRKRVDVGLLPELNAVELEAQLYRDSANLIAAETGVQQLLLQMKAILNLDASVAFDVETPPLERIPIDNLGELQPEAIFSLAVINLPQQKIIDLRLQAAKKEVVAAKGMLYPSIQAFGGLGSNYVNIKIPQYEIGTPKITSAFVTVGSTSYNVMSPSFVQVGEKTIPLGEQLKKNFGQNIGISIGIPLFNSGSAQTRLKQTQLTVKQWELNKEQDNHKLKQDVYKAYHDALSAVQKYNADGKSVSTAKKSFEFAQKRYDQNLLSTFDLINSQNNYLRSKIQALYSQFDYVFKMKLLEFYKGQGIKL
ncbi:MAG: TolC family protein [Chitinophagaceae bacterium]|nr:MAG: TolC family protein [Chitinophagaceae bacterium]